MNHSYPSAFDRRAKPRFEITAPLTILAEGREISAFTRDISNIGVFFLISPVDTPRIGQTLKFVIELPAEVTLSNSCRIQCLGRVIRTNDLSGEKVGVAAQVLRYSFMSDDVPSPRANAADA